MLRSKKKKGGGGTHGGEKIGADLQCDIDSVEVSLES